MLRGARSNLPVSGRVPNPGAHHGHAAKLSDPRAQQVPHARIYIGEVQASAKPLLLQTLLGSCVAVCLRDPVAEIGGMNHILLPSGSTGGIASRFGSHAMETLINKMMKLGGDRRRFVAKSFGGGNVLSCLQPPTVGDLNAQFVSSFLAAESIPLVAQRFGGSSAVQVTFRTDTGHATVRPVTRSSPTALVAQEETYGRDRMRELSGGGEIVLF